MRPARSPAKGNAAVVFLTIAVIGAAGAILGFFARRANNVRVAAYRADRYCGTLLTAAALDAAASDAPRSCVLTRAIVADRWTYYGRKSRYYRLTVAMPDGQLDSVELKGSRAHVAWDSASIGKPIVVEAFIDPTTGRRHVTAVRHRGVIQTYWNPEYRAASADAILTVFSCLAVAGGIGTVVTWLLRRPRFLRGGTRVIDKGNQIPHQSS